MKKRRDLTKGNILRALLIVAIPTLLTSLIQMAYNLTDMYWIAQVANMGFDPEEAVSAVGLAGYYPWLGFGLIMLAKIGTSVKISQAEGMHDDNLVERIGNNGIIFMFVLGIFYTLFGVYGAEFFISFFKTGNVAIDTMGVSYMRIVSSFGLMLYMANLFNGVYDGLGKTINTFFVSFSGLFLNIILDPIFILDEINILGMTIQGLGMGVEGAAYATGIGQVSIVLIYIAIYSNKTYRPFTIHLVKYFDKKIIKEIGRIGIYVTLQSMLFTLIAMVVARYVAPYGDAPMAIQRVGSQIESVAWMIASGFQVALASFVGQNFGAEKYDRIKEGYRTSMRLLVPYGLMVNILLFVFARQLFALFFDDSETLAIGKTYLEILSISQLFMIVELASAGVFNGLGKTVYPSIVSISGNLLRIPAAIILGASMGYAGIWWGVSMSSVIKGTVLVIWLIYFLRRLGKPDGLVFENTL